ncbi:MAG: hypothetical protein EAZ36_01125 [Verrucomicrobia bacterium]|nr:MAG: hypothetical protein EAZ36_01125 [Verrucomicrobiota bacterium]
MSRRRKRSRFRSGFGSSVGLVFQIPWLRYSVAAGLLFSLSWMVPRWWCARDGHRWYRGDHALIAAHARTVVAGITSESPPSRSGSAPDRAESELRFDTYHWSAVALLQLCLAHPELRAQWLPAVEQAIELMCAEPLREFDTARWGEDALTTLESGERGHAHFLGGLNLVLSLHRRVDPQSRFAPLNDRISFALARRLVTSRHGMIESSRGVAYPVDNASVLVSLLLHQRVAGASHATAVGPLLARFRQAWRDSHSGLLHHALNPDDGQPIGVARASASARAAFLLSFAEREVARDLYQTTRDRCADAFIGFGYVKEYYVRAGGHRADMLPTPDDQAVVLGLSPSALGFGLGAARRFNDSRHFFQLYRTAHLAGLPIRRADKRAFVAGGALANAVLLAALTAAPESP